MSNDAGKIPDISEETKISSSTRGSSFKPTRIVETNIIPSSGVIKGGDNIARAVGKLDWRSSSHEKEDPFRGNNTLKKYNLPYNTLETTVNALIRLNRSGNMAKLQEGALELADKFPELSDVFFEQDLGKIPEVTASSSSTSTREIQQNAQPQDTGDTMDRKQKQWNKFAELRDNERIDDDIKRIRQEVNSLKFTLNQKKDQRRLAVKAEMIQRIMARIDSFGLKGYSIDKYPLFGNDSKPPDEDPSQREGEYPIALNHMFQLKNDKICKYSTQSSKLLREAIETLENKVKPTDSTLSNQ